MANTISLLSGWMLRRLMSIILLAPLMRHDLCTFICGNVHLSDQNPVESLFANIASIGIPIIKIRRSHDRFISYL